jgi:hypothetical protein
MKFPDNLAQHAEPDFGVLGLQTETTDETAHLRLRQRRGLRIQIAARPESSQQNGCDAFDILRGSKLRFRQFRKRPAVSGKLVQAHGDRLSKVHRWVVFPRRNVDEPIAVAERLVGKTHLFRTEQKGDTVAGEFFVDQASALLQWAEGVTHIPASDRRGSDDQTAIRYSCGHFFVFLGAGEQLRGTHSRPRLPKPNFVRIHDPQAQESEVAHGTSCRSQVERIARGDQDDTQVIEFCRHRQDRYFTPACGKVTPALRAAKADLRDLSIHS